MRTGLRLATATPALAARRLAHEHTHAEHARHARTTRARLASRAHALTWQHTQHTSKSLAAVLESLATGCPSAGSPLAHLARMRSTNTLAISAARPHVSPTCCACHPPPPLHVASVRRVLMTLIESKTIDTMKIRRSSLLSRERTSTSYKICARSSFSRILTTSSRHSRQRACVLC